jgi:hypothetical protein
MKLVTIKGEEYKILPSLKNMCLIEDDMPGYNLALGVPADKANLHFMASCIKRCIVTMDDKPLPKEVFEDIFTRDTDEEFNEIYLAVFTEMYKLPPKDDSVKN